MNLHEMSVAAHALRRIRRKRHQHPAAGSFHPPMPPRKKAMPPHEDMAFPSFRHVHSELYFVLNVHFDVQAE